MDDNNQVCNLDQDEFQNVDLAPIRLDRLGIERNSKSEYKKITLNPLKIVKHDEVGYSAKQTVACSSE